MYNALYECAFCIASFVLSVCCYFMGGYHQVFEKKTRTLNTLRSERLKRVLYVKHALRRILLKSLLASDNTPMLQKARISYSINKLPQLSSSTKQVNRC